ncbi:hypothetical protein PR202_ga28285 [Eleusine coracana subsp. coracana]|uniref:Alpha/beta hydrolase fold-3 domain-containing protein n=1 Tax=Eleusine coracana subsp. coracana TaxID=191504 RepID=A0AAV5DIU9_ELECO|nr:hypothetical protein QOZ80_7AG0556510 [Eleusine coracana subsp. coracana]GJN10208.1 hypothetical protein PR202_ga28285 [Eleusine coracana subsp. coracana]
MPESHVVEQDLRGLVQLMSDVVTVRRGAEPPASFQADVVTDDDSGVEWKDVTWEPEMDLSARLSYRPRHDARIPVVAYCLGRWPGPHAWCLRLAAELPTVVVISFYYRLAPEHRLTATHDDGANAMAWLKTHAAAADPCLADNSAEGPPDDQFGRARGTAAGGRRSDGAHIC